MDNLTELYVLMDDFCKEFEPWLSARLLAEGQRKRKRMTGLSLAELMTLVVLFLKGACTGISIIDSTPIAVCDNLRIKRHCVFKDIAQRGKSSTGWFFSDQINP
jgi:hypothetical protein